MYPMLGKGKCEIIPIAGACLPWTNNMDAQWFTCNRDVEHPRYWRVDNVVYVSNIGSFNEWKPVTFDNSSTTEEEFDDINQVIIDGISYKIWSFVTRGYFGTVSNDNTKKDGYYMLKFTSNNYTIQEDVILYGRKCAMGEQVGNTS